MIVRITAKLGKKIGFMPTEVLPLGTNPFIDWTAYLFLADRVQYIILTNTVSLYSFIMYGRGITDDSVFLERTIGTMTDTLRHDRCGFIAERLIVPHASRISFSRSLSRSVTGSMNELVLQAKYHLQEEEISPFELSLNLNETPLSAIGYQNLKKAFSRLKIT